MKTGLSTQVRIQLYDECDIPRIARVHLQAFAGFANANLGYGYACAMLRWFRNYPQGIALAAWLDEDIVGYVVGAPIDYHKAFHRALLLPATVNFLTHPRAWISRKVYSAILARLKSLFSRKQPLVSVELPLPAYSLVSIAVSPGTRGKGIGQRLIAEFENYARQYGARAIRLSTRADNREAIALYTRCGWHPFAASFGSLCYLRLFDTIPS